MYLYDKIVMVGRMLDRIKRIVVSISPAAESYLSYLAKFITVCDDYA